MLGLDEKRKFTNITFKDCSYNGKWLGSFADGDFLVNKFVENITFYLSHVPTSECRCLAANPSACSDFFDIDQVRHHARR